MLSITATASLVANGKFPGLLPARPFPWDVVPPHGVTKEVLVMLMRRLIGRGAGDSIASYPTLLVYGLEKGSGKLVALDRAGIVARNGLLSRGGEVRE